ncbi:MAG TPA: MFS transporter [Ktedonobacteraceae bacterium]
MNAKLGEKRATGELEGEERRRRWPAYALFLGNTISYMGDIMSFLAIPWFVLQTTGSVEKAGITGFFSALPMVVSAFLGSVLVDRLGYKRTSVIGDVLCGLTALLIPLLYHTVGLAFWQMLALVFCGGLLRSPADTARDSLVPDLAKLAGMRLERANAWNDGTVRGARFLAAPLAGLLITLIGTSNLLWLDAASFAISALLIGLSVPAHIQSRAQDEQKESRGGYLAELKEGLRFVRLDVVISTIVGVVMITNMLDAASSAVVMPVYVMQTFHSALFQGILMSAFGGAAFVGAAIFGTIGHRLPRRLTFGLCFTIGAALRFWVLLTANFPLILGWFLLSGLMIGPINSLIATALQERTPPAMRSRVFGLVGAGAMAGNPLGTFAAGFVIAWLGLHWTLFAMGALYLLATLSILVNPKMKAMNHSQTM